MKMAKLSNQLDIGIKILSPVHIGDGKLLVRGVDFVEEGSIMHLLDKEKLYLSLSDSEQEQYLSLLAKGSLNEAENWIFENANVLKASLKATPLNSSIDAAELRSLIRNGNGNPYIPGSSIKGAIRSVLFNYLANREREKYVDRDIENRLMGSFQRAVTRYILPSDADIPQSEITNVALFNLQKRGFDWKSYYGSKGMPSDKLLVCETFTVGAKGKFRLTIATEWLKMVRQKAEGAVHPNTKHVIRPEKPIQYLFKLVNEYTREHLRREIAFFEEYNQAENTDFIIHQLKELKKKTENNARSCILRMSYASGFHGITGDWRFDNHVAVVDDPVLIKMQGREEERRLKSRRIAKHAALTAACMGFVELTLPEEAEDIPFTPTLDVDEVGSRPIPPGKITPKEKEAKTITFDKIGDKTVFYVEVVEVGKPWSKVKLLLDDYPFVPYANLSGTKKVNLLPGMIVEVVVNSRTKAGEIKLVTYRG